MIFFERISSITSIGLYTYIVDSKFGSMKIGTVQEKKRHAGKTTGDGTSMVAFTIHTHRSHGLNFLMLSITLPIR